MREQELAHHDQIRALKTAHAQALSEARADLEKRAKQMADKWEKRLQREQEQSDLQRRTEVREIEQRKNAEIHKLIENHEKTFGDIKTYYNDITLNNLSLINSLKEEMEALKKKEEKVSKQMNDVQAENKKLTEPLKEAKEQVVDLNKQLVNYKQGKNSIKILKSQLKTVTDENKKLKWEMEILQQRFLKVESERDEVYQKFLGAISEVQQKSNFKNLLLEKQLKLLTDNLEKKEAELGEVLSASNMESKTSSSSSTKVDDIIKSKNTIIDSLQNELAKAKKDHSAAVKKYEAELEAAGLRSSLNVKPMDTKT